MKPATFDESNETIVYVSESIPIYEAGQEAWTCWEFTEEEWQHLAATRKLWVKSQSGPPLPFYRPSVYSPFKKSLPLIVDEAIADRVILHTHENEELIILKLEPGLSSPWAKYFKEPVELLGDGMDNRIFRDLCERYKIDPWLAVFFKRLP